MKFYPTRGRGTPAHCDASRISAGVQFINSAAARPNHAKHTQNLSIPCSKGSKPFQIPPQTVPKPCQSDPKSIQKASWGPSWTNAFTRYDFESPKKRQNTPKSDHKAAQSVPNPSQIEPNTFQNQIFGRFFAHFLNRKFTSILYRFFRDFYMFF